MPIEICNKRHCVIQALLSLQKFARINRSQVTETSTLNEATYEVLIDEGPATFRVIADVPDLESFRVSHFPTLINNNDWQLK